jgi:hypothetical protein
MLPGLLTVPQALATDKLTAPAQLSLDGGVIGSTIHISNFPPLNEVGGVPEVE